MNGALGLAVLAVVYTVPLLVVLFVPYVAWTYRARGGFGLRPALAAAAGVLWVAALWAYTVLPVPDADSCRRQIRPQLRPFAFLGDIDAGPGPALLRDPALLQVVLNVALFVPLGVGVALLVRRRRLLAGVAAGFGVSLSVELVQLTGTLGVFDCAYRLFDVDDLLANTFGTVLGVLAGPLARRLVGRRTVAPVRALTARRRLVGVLVDLFAWLVASLVTVVGYGAVQLVLGRSSVEVGMTRANESLLVGIAPGLVLLVLLPVVTRGRTVGRWATACRPVTAGHRRPTRARTLAHSVIGGGGLLTLWSVDPDSSWVRLVVVGWLLVSLVLVVRGDHRGLSGAVTGLAMVDVRDPELLERDRAAGRRRPLLAVRTVSLAAFAAYAALLLALRGLDELGGAEGVALLAPVLGTLVASQVVASGYLVGNGVVMLRKEGRSLGNLLALLAGLGSAGLVLLGVLAVLVAGDVVRTVVLVLSVLASWGALVFIALVLVGRSYGRVPTAGDVDVVVALGSRLLRGKVPPLLAARLETARTVRDEALARGGDPLVVCSGGQGPDESATEGRAMSDWLAARGVPADRLVAEERARTTQENLVLSLDLAGARGVGASPVVVTNGYHVFRAALLAEDLGLDVRVAAGPTAPYFLPSALLREHVAVLRRTRWLQAVLALCLALLSVLAVTA